MKERYKLSKKKKISEGKEALLLVADEIKKREEGKAAAGEYKK